ncbi:MAG TPA: asparaginase [Thermomicrobiales bacterium]|nr:asparaginase [Thermomicrobiales bacterium]
MLIDHDIARADLPRLRLFTTGGTIASRRDPTTAAVAVAASGEQLLARLPDLPALAELAVEPVASVNGWNMTPELMFDLARRVNKTLAISAVDGVIVTHGTDTVEETAFLLDLLVWSPKPVVFAVALRHLDELGTDGPRNLRDAIAVATSPASHGRGTLLVANQMIHAARFVTKIHTTSLNAFASPGCGPEGLLNGIAVEYLHPPRTRQVIEVDRVETRVLLLKAYAGADDSLFHHGIAAGYRGFVIEGTGSGNVPAAMVPGIEAALHAAIPVVLCSRVSEGPLTTTYGGGPAAHGGGHDLASLGVIPAPGLPGQKARVMLMVALGLTSDREIIRRIFRDGTGA